MAAEISEDRRSILVVSDDPLGPEWDRLSPTDDLDAANRRTAVVSVVLGFVSVVGVVEAAALILG